jgi:hypothetical protein
MLKSIEKLGGDGSNPKVQEVLTTGMGEDTHEELVLPSLVLSPFSFDFLRYDTSRSNAQHEWGISYGVRYCPSLRGMNME